MGLEHLGVVVGEGVDAFSRDHRDALTGQQNRGRCAAERRLYGADGRAR
jgi:hypothetical protein